MQDHSQKVVKGDSGAKSSTQCPLKLITSSMPPHETIQQSLHDVVSIPKFINIASFDHIKVHKVMQFNLTWRKLQKKDIQENFKFFFLHVPLATPLLLSNKIISQSPETIL